MIAPQLKFIVTHQTIQRDDQFNVVGDSQNYLYAQFEFTTEEWDGLVKTALFRNGTDGTVYEMVLENDQCLVPHEVLSGKDRFMYVSVFAGDLITVNKERVHIESSGYWEDAESSEEPTPSVYQQIMTRLEDVENTVVESAESAQQSAESASASANSADESAIAAHEDALAAAESATQAHQSESSALSSAEQASEKAEQAKAYNTEARSWAVGDTNTRTDEEIDNAKYYAEQSKKYSEDFDWLKIKNRPETLAEFGIDEVPASLLVGKINIDNIPKSAIERIVVVSNDNARFALTTDDVQNGDVVKVESSGLMYYIKDDTKLNSDDGYESFRAGSAATVPFSGVTEKPNTLSGYGITDAYTKTETDNKLAEKVDEVSGKGLSTNDYTDEDKAKLQGIQSGAEANVNPDWNATSGDAEILNKPNTLSGYGVDSVPASMIDGVIGIEHIPPAAIERLVIVPTEAAKYLLSKDNVQNGDSVKVLANGKTYIIVDDANLDNENGYLEYTAGSASSVPWSGVTNKPTTASGYGITDVYSKTEIDTSLGQKVDAETGKGLSTNDYTDAEKEKLQGIEEGANVNVNADWNANSGDAQILNKPTTLSGYGVQEVPVSMLSGVIDISHIPQGALERLVVVSNLAAMYALTNEQVQKGDVVQLNDTGEMYYVVDDTNLDSSSGYKPFTASTASSVPWSGVTDKPTSIAGYGILDAYTKTESDNLLDQKVDKVTGKGLSTNDYTTAEKDKLASIADGADEANANIAIIESSPSTHAYAENDLLVFDGILYKVKTAIAVGDVLIENTNIEKTTIGKALSSVQPSLTFDTTPTENSTNPVTSGGIYVALQNVDNSEEMTLAQYNALTIEQQMDGSIRFITDVDTEIPDGEGRQY